ncbi:NAD(P)H-hydrate dehydratase [uncultured Sphingomonas sp.]|uniref:NAD(P)H-hydrate dehydratase n=1 Tax=uncultured Sphingomonas sp. TaxID=158754 RepID=UPI0025EA3683|nr:NAD(P)H-hydrate dehydratase [uncultured Sphingomonas sp.]
MSPPRIDRDWRCANPLPPIDSGTDKNSRGRVLAVGGGRRVPGGLALVAEAALRVGAGKVRMATIEPLAIPLGLLMPEAGMVALPENERGEIAADAAPLIREQMETCEAAVLGAAMSGREEVDVLLRASIAAPRDGLALVLDAACVACAGSLADMVAAHGGRAVLTPHHGEMASLTGQLEQVIGDDPERAAVDAARRFGAVIVLKSARTVIAAPDGTLLTHHSDTPGLGTGGSGDVLAGIIGGVLARGCAPLTAAGWGVWLHAQVGLAAANEIGPVGFLGRDLPPRLPRLLAAHAG